VRTRVEVDRGSALEVSFEDGWTVFVTTAVTVETEGRTQPQGGTGGFVEIVGFLTHFPPFLRKFLLHPATLNDPSARGAERRKEAERLTPLAKLFEANSMSV
jgi:hypothetical protein